MGCFTFVHSTVNIFVFIYLRIQKAAFTFNPLFMFNLNSDLKIEPQTLQHRLLFMAT